MNKNIQYRTRNNEFRSDFKGSKTSSFEIPCWIFDIQYPLKLGRLNNLATQVHADPNLNIKKGARLAAAPFWFLRVF
jgi:hypothetical protein